MRDIALIVCLVFAFGAPALAQDAPRVGDLVEARIMEATDPAPVRVCVAPLTAVT